MVKEKRERPDSGDVLDLGATTAKLPRLVKIDGVFYEMVNVDEMGIGPRERLTLLMRRIEELEKKGARATAKEEAEYDGRLLAISKVILPTAPPAKINKLSIGSRQSLVLDFFFVIAAGTPRMQTVERARTFLGSRSAPGSSAATAARSSTGTSGRRSG